MLLTEVVPRTLASFDLDDPDDRHRLGAVYARPEASYVRLNMITALTGGAVGADGTSDTLTSPADRTVLGIIRREADVVLVGAQSVRAEGYTVPRTARLAIATVSGDLSGHDLVRRLPGGHDGSAGDAAEDRVLVLCPASRAGALEALAEVPGVAVVSLPGEGALEPALILAALRDRGLARVVCEGGPALASQFATAGLIDEYCVTVAPEVGPVPTPFLRLATGAGPQTAVAGHLVDEAGFSYLRLRAR